MENTFDIVVAMHGAKLQSFEVSRDLVSLNFLKLVDEIDWKFTVKTDCLVTSSMNFNSRPTEAFFHDLALIYSILDKRLLSIWEIDSYSCKLKFEDNIEAQFIDLYRDDISELMVIEATDWPNLGDKSFCTI